ncbi:MAG TPA: hypothetical protein VGM39_24815 [Kofleriaceae bacterium]|jgi:metal-responsive CopG/Arc/MetJ family transcriptional regulator
MKTAVSVPDEVFKQAERLARSRKVSRSQLYTEALKRMIAGEQSAHESVTSAYNSAFADDADRFVADASRKALLDVEWDE